jgi:hypothetical protein
MQEEGVHRSNRLDTSAGAPVVLVTTRARVAVSSMRGTRAIPSEIGSEISHRCGDPAAHIVAH